jgi:hypothetical protein
MSSLGPGSIGKGWQDERPFPHWKRSDKKCEKCNQPLYEKDQPGGSHITKCWGKCYEDSKRKSDG